MEREASMMTSSFWLEEQIDICWCYLKRWQRRSKRFGEGMEARGRSLF
jgi:hypothetical protein